MYTILILFKSLLNNLGFVTIISLLLSKIKAFKKIIAKDNFNKIDLIVLSIVFGALGILGTYLGIDINGAIANTRIMPIVAGGILCGPMVGTFSGVIAGVHRFLINPNGITTIQCSIITILGGITGGILHQKLSFTNKKIFVSFLTTIIIELVEMIIIILFSNNIDSSYTIVKNIFLPMALSNGIGVLILIDIVENSIKEREEIAAKRAKISLDIANKTLPYFKHGENAYKMICEEIKNSINCDAVAITNADNIISYVGLGSDYYRVGIPIRNNITKNVIKTKKRTIINNYSDNDNFNNIIMKSTIIIPILDDEDVIGTLKIFYQKENMITEWISYLTEGLAKMLSSQLSIIKAREIERTAAKAELKALQYQINPHFLFNALNTISYFVRIKPDEARELIILLSNYLRYNLNAGDKFVDINNEIEQIKDYVNIEKARFGDKFIIEYDIDDNLNVKIPPLLIQPLVENSFKHGISKIKDRGMIRLSIKNIDKKSIKISVYDNGIGIDDNIIKSIREGTISKDHIGLYNVNNRLNLIYNSNLLIEKLDKGTKVEFFIKRGIKSELYNS